MLTRVPGDGALGDGHGLAQLVPGGGPEQTRPAGSLRDVRVGGRAEPFEQGSPGAAVFVLLAEEEAKLGVPIPGVVLEPSPKLVLAMALHQKGKADEARKTLASAVLSHDWAANRVVDQHGCIAHSLRREAEAMILPELPAFLDGKYQPRDNDERLALLGVCQFTNRTCTAARLYSDAFAADAHLAEDPRSGHRQNAARAAALAGCGRGADGTKLDEAARALWRRQARDWLRADLVAWAATLDGGSPAARTLVRKTLAQWQVHPDLTGLREASARDKLSPDERTECLALWQAVGDLLRRAREGQ